MAKNNKKQKPQNKKVYVKPELKKHSKIESRPAEIFTTYCCGVPELFA